VDNGAPGTPIHYFTHQFFGNLVEEQNNGAFVSLPKTINDTSPVFAALDRNFDPSMPFKVVYQVNANNIHRMLVGTANRLYESINSGFSFTSLGGVESFV